MRAEWLASLDNDRAEEEADEKNEILHVEPKKKASVSLNPLDYVSDKDLMIMHMTKIILRLLVKIRSQTEEELKPVVSISTFASKTRLSSCSAN